MPNNTMNESEIESVKDFIIRCLQMRSLGGFFKERQSLEKNIWDFIKELTPDFIFRSVHWILRKCLRIDISIREVTWKRFFLRLLICLDSDASLFSTAQQFLKWGLAYKEQMQEVKELEPEFHALLFCDRLHYLNEVISKESISWYAQMDLKTLQSKFDEVKGLFPEGVGSAGFWQSLSYGFKVDAVREALVTNEKLWLSCCTSKIIDAVPLLDAIYGYRDLYPDNCNGYFYAVLIQACLKRDDVDSALKNVKKCYAGESRTSVSKRSGAPSSPSNLACNFLSSYASSSPVKRSLLITEIERAWPQPEDMPSEISGILEKQQSVQAKERLIYPPPPPPSNASGSDLLAVDDQLSTFSKCVSGESPASEALPAESLAYPPPSLYVPPNTNYPPYSENGFTSYLQASCTAFSRWLTLGEPSGQVKEDKAHYTGKQLEAFCGTDGFSPAAFMDYLFVYSWGDNGEPESTLTSIMLCLCALATQPVDSSVYKMVKKLSLWEVIVIKEITKYPGVMRNSSMLRIYLRDILSGDDELLDYFASIGMYRAMNLDCAFKKPDPARNQLISKIAETMRRSEKFRKSIVLNPSFHCLAGCNLEIFLTTIQFNLGVTFSEEDKCLVAFCAAKNSLSIKEIGGSEILDCEWVLQHPQILPYLSDASKEYVFGSAAVEVFARSMPAPLTTYTSDEKILEKLQLQFQSFLVNHSTKFEADELSLWFCLEIIFMSSDRLSGAFTSVRSQHTITIANIMLDRVKSKVLSMSDPQQFGKNFAVFCKNHIEGLQANGSGIAAVIADFPIEVIKSIDLDVMSQVLANIQGLAQLDENLAKYFANQLCSYDWIQNDSGAKFFEHNPDIVCQVLKFFNVAGLRQFILWVDFPAYDNHSKRAIITSICQDENLLRLFQDLSASATSLLPKEQIFLLYLVVKTKLLQEPLGRQLTSADVLSRLKLEYPDTISELRQDSDDFDRTCEQAGVSGIQTPKGENAAQDAGSAPVAETATKVPAYPPPPSYVECMAQPGNRFRFEFIPPASPGDGARSETSDHQSEEYLRSAIMRTVGAILGAVPEVHEIGSLDAVLTMLKACAATLRAGEDSATTSQENLSPPSDPSSPSP